MDDILIVGGGIGGLTLGLALHAANIPCRIFESAPEIRAVGVGINLLPHATKELAALGLEADLARVAIATKDSTFFNRFGQLIYQEPLGRAAGYDHPQFSIHRGDLQMVLLEAFKSRAGADRILTNHHCTGVEQDDAGVTLHFSVGQSPRQKRARPRRDCLRRHQFGDPQAIFPRRRRAALFRRQHVARRHAVEADPVGRKHDARGLAVAWQDGDLSDP